MKSSAFGFFAIFLGLLGFGLVCYKNFLKKDDFVKKEEIVQKEEQFFFGQKPGQLIVINGTASTDKVWIAKHLQLMLGATYLHISLNTFLDMLSWDVCNLNASTYRFLESNQGIYAAKKNDESLEIKIGPLGKKIIHDMGDAIEALLLDGWNVILTTIMTAREDVLDFKYKFRKYNPYFVYVYADKEFIAQRDAARKDRLAGYALSLLDEFTSQGLHDVQIDISKLTQEQVAEKIYEVVC